MGVQTEECRIRLVLVDEQVLLRASLSRFLATQPGFEVVGECATAAEALAILSGSSVDIVLMDLDRRTESRDEFVSLPVTLVMLDAS
jgi:DNA-binding NarL/FixJ family response regulator